jgi:hypothetical protein
MDVTSTSNIFDFLSRECKNNNHDQCYGMWYGLGFEVLCSCKCSHLKKKGLEQEVARPACSNTLGLIQSVQQHEVAIG